MTEIDGSPELEAVETVAVPETTDAPPEAPATTEEEVKQEERTFTREEHERAIQAAKAKLERKFEREYRARLEAENERLKAQVSPPKKEEAPGKPKREDYQDDVSFIEDLAGWKADQKIGATLKVREQETQAQATQREFAKVLSDHEKRVEAVRASTPDYDEIVGNDELHISKAMAEAIVLSESGPQLALYLGKNPAEADRIARLHPSLAGVELGKLEAKLSAPGAKTISNAPAPLKPVGSTKALVADLAKMSQEEYEKYRAKNGARWAR